MNELMWLSKHKKLAEKHSGEWIAVLDNKIISSGNSAKDVLKLVTYYDRISLILGKCYAM